jgi:hypothetical protein
MPVKETDGVRQANRSATAEHAHAVDAAARPEIVAFLKVSISPNVIPIYAWRRN